MTEVRRLYVSTSPKGSGADKDTTEYLKKKKCPFLLEHRTHPLGTCRDVIREEKPFNKKWELKFVVVVVV